MLFVKNLPLWERMLRFVIVLAMAAGAWHFWPSLLGMGLAAMAVFIALTAVFGWCPACAVAGRRLTPKIRD